MNDEQPNASSGVEPTRNGRNRGTLHQRLHSHRALALTTKVVVTTVGVLVLVAGLVMMVTPGPGIVGIVVGLAILATEYDWADRWLQAARRKAKQAKEKAEAMDPAVRRRRLLWGTLALVLVLLALAGYVAVFDWPPFAVSGWDWVQRVGEWVPELPGM